MDKNFEMPIVKVVAINETDIIVTSCTEETEVL